jgi:hypothetical protein
MQLSSIIHQSKMINDPSTTSLDAGRRSVDFALNNVRKLPNTLSSSTISVVDEVSSKPGLLKK